VSHYIISLGLNVDVINCSDAETGQELMAFGTGDGEGVLTDN
jgi:hypothetical protein